MSRVVFVGNVPYDVEEDKLIPIFSTVGPIAGFRLMIEKDTGKSKGYAFCEYQDHDTAASAVRNLNGTEVNGRPLRIDLADSDPFFEGKTTQAGRTRGDDGPRERGRPGDPLANLPSGAPLPPGTTATDMITNVLATIPSHQMMDILGQMKAYVVSSPEHARALFNANPQLAYAFFQAMVLNNLVDQSVLQRMLTSAALQAPPPQASGGPAAYRGPPQAAQSSAPTSYYHPPPQPQAPPQAAYGAPSSYPPQTSYQSAPPTGPRMQPAAPKPAAAPAPDIPEDQRAMLMQILSLTPDQINALPPAERATVQQLRAQFVGGV